MKKKREGLFQCLIMLALAFCLLAGVKTKALADDYKLAIAGEWVPDSNKNASGTGWTYNGSTKTITLNGLSYNQQGNSAIFAYDMQNLNIVLKGNNTITTTGDNDVSIDVALTSGGTLSFSGTGSLKVSGGNGAIMTTGNITISSCNIEAECSGNNNNGGIAIKAGGNLSINNASIKATGGTGTNMPISAGLFAEETVTIQNSTVTAIGKDAKESCGIFSRKSDENDTGLKGIEIKNSTVNASAGKAESYELGASCGMEVLRGNITITDNSQVNASSTDIRIGVGINAWKLTIDSTAKSVTVQGNYGAAPNYCRIVNGIPGDAWTDIDGTTGWKVIPVLSNPNDLYSYGFKKVVFAKPETTKYLVTVNNGTGGGNYAAGTTVTITASAPATGKAFDKWTSSDGVAFSNANASTTTFVMPAKAVSVTATYKDAEVAPVKYTVSFDSNGGSGTMTPVEVSKGSSYKLPLCTFTAPEGKEFDKWDKGAVGESITVTADITIKAEWKNKSGSSSPEPSTPTDPTTPTDPADPAKPTDPTEQTKPTDIATDSSKQVTAEDSTAAKNAEEKAENINKKQKNTSISKLKAGKKSITISWKKLTAKDIKGYEIQYSTDKAFKKDVKTVNIGKTKTTSKTIKKLTSKKKYYVRIRTYKKSGGEKIYSKWSKSKSVKVK
ncbi:InlB B-repeat-containing protein [Butyrivibrio sp. WCD3002]|uniref:InlB B-repeat-containing protein n=1 Tax=Butyrivibrio sp. WCD3002 TaxID=1280676 RepID=UPI0005672FEC|nr:fibronectin type III domain-containing protein [Butyrivibrio sp. WCD3002]